MSFSGFQPAMLPLLYEQHHNYTVELGKTHEALSKLYKKLAKVERTLAEREERGLSRTEKKKGQYTRALSKRAVSNLESKQASLHDHLRQCNDLIASMEHGAYHNPLMSPWASQMPPSPFLFTPYSPVATSPWAAALHHSSNSDRTSDTPRPQFWDLSMLPESHQDREASPFGSSANSGSYEVDPPAQHGIDVNEIFDDENHVFAHEVMAPAFNETPESRHGQTSSAVPDEDHRDDVAELQSQLSPSAKTGAEKSRCYSADAIDLDLSHLAVVPAEKKRISMGPPARKEE